MRRVAAYSIVALVAFGVCQTPEAYAETPDPAAVSFAKSFAKICLLAAPNFESVGLTAILEGWEQVEGEKHPSVFYSTSSPTRSSWQTRGVDGLPIRVMLARKGRGAVNAMHITCAVQNPDVSPAAVAKAIGDLLPLPPPDPEYADGDRRFTEWTLHYGASEIVIGLGTDKSNKIGAVLNAINLQETARQNETP